MASVPIISRRYGLALTLQNNNTTLSLISCFAAPTQIWDIEPLDDGNVRIVNPASGKVLDVEGASLADGAPIIPWDWHGGPNQRFKVLGDPFDFSTSGDIVAAHSGKVIIGAGTQFGWGFNPPTEVPNSALPDETPLIQWNRLNGGDSWRLSADYIFSGRSRSKVLDVQQANTGTGVPLIQWTPNYHSNQWFRLEAVQVGQKSLVRIVAAHSGRVLDVYGASTENGAPIIHWDWTGGQNQLFYMTPKEGGVYAFTNMLSRKVLEVRGGSTAEGAVIQQWDDSFAPQQRWII